MTDETPKTTSLDVLQDNAANPFGESRLPSVPQSSGAMAQSQRVMQEVTAAMHHARMMPRSEQKSMERILKVCQRKTLAEKAIYSYPKGGTQVEGISISLARAIAREWGNLSFGVREVARYEDSSEMEAFCIDLEKVIWSTRTFHVKHWRDTKSGGYAIRDEREIYELTANMGARRERACILEVIPQDVQDAAEQQCNNTLSQGGGSLEARIDIMKAKFAELGVTESMLEKRLQKRLGAIAEAEIPPLQKIYVSLRDGMTRVDNWFEREGDTHVVTTQSEPRQDDTPAADGEAASAPAEHRGGDAGEGAGKRSADVLDEHPDEVSGERAEGPGSPRDVQHDGDDSPELDSEGELWDPAIHAGTRDEPIKNKDGTWRKKRGRKPASDKPSAEVGASTATSGQAETPDVSELPQEPNADEGEPMTPEAEKPATPALSVPQWSNFLDKCETREDFEDVREMIGDLEPGYDQFCNQIWQQAFNEKFGDEGESGDGNLDLE